MRIKIFFGKTWRGRTMVVLLLFLHALLWVFALRFPAENTPLLLHYRVSGGADLIGFRSTLLAIPLTGLVVLILNVALALLLKRRDRILPLLALAVAASTQLFLLLGLLALFLINRT